MVTLVLILLVTALGGLVITVATMTTSNRTVLKQRKTRLECEGLARVTSAEVAAMVAAGTATREAIDAKLGQIRGGAFRDGIRGVQIEAKVRDTGVITSIPAGPLIGLPYIEQMISTRLRMQEDSESCRAVAEQAVANFAITQFSSLAHEVTNTLGVTVAQRCDVAGTSFFATPAPAAAPNTGLPFAPTPLSEAIAYAVRPVHLDGIGGCSATRYVAGGVANPQRVEMNLPFIPTNMGNLSADDFKNTPYTVRREILGPLGTTAQGIVDAQQKLPMMQADIRILNGAWFKSEQAVSLDWPGTLVWSDSFDKALIGASGPRLYSVYERSNGDASFSEPAGRMFVDATNGDKGVVSYGSAHWGMHQARSTLCTSTTGPCTLRAGVVPSEPTCAAAGCAAEKLVARVARLDATRMAFRAPGIHAFNNIAPNSDTVTNRITSINIDMGFLVTAFNTPSNGELGAHFCLNDRCPRKFNGIMYISNAEGEYTIEDFVARRPPPPGSARAMARGPINHILQPLWSPAAFWTNIDSLEYGEDNIFASSTARSGPTMGITDASVFRTGPGVAPEGNGGFGYNAVRITNASDLTAFRETGFTLISAVPVFIEGDFNVTTVGGERAAVLIMAPQIIVSTPGIDEFLPPTLNSFDPPLPGIPTGPTLEVHASLLRTLHTPQGTYPNPRGTAFAATDGILSLNPGAIIKVHGAIATLPSWVRQTSYNIPNQPGVRVEHHYPLELTTATKRTDTDRRLPPGTPRVSFVQGAVVGLP